MIESSLPFKGRDYTSPFYYTERRVYCRRHEFLRSFYIRILVALSKKLYLPLFFIAKPRVYQRDKNIPVSRDIQAFGYEEIFLYLLFLYIKTQAIQKNKSTKQHGKSKMKLISSDIFF